MGALEITCIILGVLCAVTIAVNIILFVTRGRAQEAVETPAESEIAPAQAAPVEDEALDSEQAVAALGRGEVRESESGAIVVTAEGDFIYLRYNKSFTAKLIQAKDEVREYYNELKNFVTSYKKVHTRISWKHESVNNGRNKICRFVMRGKSLYVYLPLNPDDYAESKYKVERAEAKRFEEFPCLYRIKNPRRAKYATELIAVVMERYGLEREEKAEVDFIKDYPYEETLPLIKRGLIKVMRSNRKIELDDETEEAIATDRVRGEPLDQVHVAEANELMSDEEADSLVISGSRRADTTRKGIINVDVLSRYFEDGETVTLEEIKKRVPGFDRKMTFVKVLARGTLDKKLTVEADEFSVEAKKMILLMGGQVIKTYI